MQLISPDKPATENNDNLSEISEIDMDLTDINKIMTDAFNESSDKSESAADIISTDELYNFIENRLLTLDPKMTMALGKLTYHTDFHPHYFPPDKEGNFGKTLYKKSTPIKVAEDGSETSSDELGLVFFGEICSSVYGTAIYAKGNHYAGSPKFPKVCFAQNLLIFLEL